MNAVIKPCWIVRDEWGLSVLGVYTRQGTARTVARSHLSNVLANGGMPKDRTVDQALAKMVEQQTLYVCDEGDGE